MNLSFSKLSILFFLFLVLSCGKDDPDPGVLSITGTSIIFNDDESKTFTINHVSGESVNWNVVSAPAWLNITPSSGTLSSGNTTLTITGETDGFDPGKQSGVIEISGDNNQRYSVNVTVCVSPHPELTISPNNATLSQQNGFNQQIRLTNTGTGVLNIPASGASSGWLQLYIDRVSLDEGEYYDTWISACCFESLTPGTQSTSFLINSNDARGAQTLDIDLEVPEVYQLQVENSSFNFGLENELEFDILNNGNTSTSWAISNNDTPELSYNPSSGTIGLNERVTVRVTLDRPMGLPNSVIYRYGQIEITNATSNNYYAPSLNLQYLVYEENKTILNGRVSDALIEKISNRMLLAKEAPNALEIYDPSTSIIETISLAFAPINIETSNNGDYALIQGINEVSLIDLSNNSQSSYSTTGIIDASEVGNSGEVFLFVNSRLIYIDNLGNETEIDITASEINDAKIHSSEDYIYGISEADRTISKFDLTATLPTFVNSYNAKTDNNDSPQFKIWLSDNGLYLFTQGGTVFELDASSENGDIKFDRQLTYESIIEMDYSSPLNSIVVLSGSVDENGGQSYIYNRERFRANNFAYENGYIPGPQYLYGDPPNQYLNEGNITHIALDEINSMHIVISNINQGNGETWAISSETIQ